MSKQHGGRHRLHRVLCILVQVSVGILGLAGTAHEEYCAGTVKGCSRCSVLGRS
jgi:hypothetical protein